MEGRGARDGVTQALGSALVELRDGIHSNTIIQGLIANEIIDALNSNYGHQIAPLSDAELLELAGVPEPHISLLLGLGVLAVCKSARHSGRS